MGISEFKREVEAARWDLEQEVEAVRRELGQKLEAVRKRALHAAFMKKANTLLHDLEGQLLNARGLSDRM